MLQLKKVWERVPIPLHPWTAVRATPAKFSHTRAKHVK